jgi:hypothetical protein
MRYLLEEIVAYDKIIKGIDKNEQHASAFARLLTRQVFTGAGLRLSWASIAFPVAAIQIVDSRRTLIWGPLPVQSNR